METPSLEEVKEYFKNAKEVKGNIGIYTNSISEIKYKKIYYSKKGKGFYITSSQGNGDFCVYCCEENKYAEIISYKYKTYQLSETFVKELCKEPNIKEAFIREGIIDETIEVKKSVILNTPNDLELGKLIRKMV